MITGATLPATRRLRTQRQFRAVYGRGRRAAGKWLLVVALRQRHGSTTGPRLGVSVSKDHGGAVRRNKLKRLLREAFRTTTAQLPPDVDLVLIPQRRDERVPLAELQRELVALVQRALAGGDRRRRSDP